MRPNPTSQALIRIPALCSNPDVLRFLGVLGGGQVSVTVCQE
jgi:hypothetical protein